MTGASASRFFRAMALLVAALACGSAEAHLNATGMGPIYDGLIHFLTSPEDLVPALGLALLAGLRGAEYGRRALCTLPAGWLVGTLAGFTATSASAGSFWASLWFLLLGALVVFDVKISLRALTVLSGFLGLVHGFLNGSGMGFSVATIVVALGLATAASILVVLATAFVVRLRVHWARVAVRVGGSWIAASGLLMLGWSMRGICADSAVKSCA